MPPRSVRVGPSPNSAHGRPDSPTPRIGRDNTRQAERRGDAGGLADPGECAKKVEAHACDPPWFAPFLSDVRRRINCLAGPAKWARPNRHGRFQGASRSARATIREKLGHRRPHQATRVHASHDARPQPTGDAAPNPARERQPAQKEIGTKKSGIMNSGAHSAIKYNRTEGVGITMDPTR